MKLFFYKLFHWEYWPFEVVYIPIYFQWIYYAFRQKSLFFFNVCNPSIKNGGFFMESKKEIYDLIQQQYYPETIIIKEKTSFEIVKNELKTTQIKFPFIAKPDIGLRGSAVKKIENFDELQSYCHKADFDYLIQDLIPFDNEIGVFYVRYPNEKLGKITGIVAKEFLIVHGNGIDSIEKLISKNPRFAFQLGTLKTEYGSRLKEVIGDGKSLNLVPFGNHARGAKFIDASHLISEKMTNVLNEICLQIDGFYFGRLDIMYNTIEEFERGLNFSIVELNGAGSEPTHIYDPRHSLIFAWKELSRHIKMMQEISVQNHKKGHPYLSHKAGMAQYKLHLKQSKKIVNF
ncbi:MAG: hypothetical protein RLZZ312_1557 [Bacteroidota bacterium]